MDNLFSWIGQLFRKTFRIIKETFDFQPTYFPPNKKNNGRKKQFEIREITSTELDSSFELAESIEGNEFEIKKFEIIQEESFSLDINTNVQSDIRFRSYGTTRPKICPYCRTNEQITRNEQEESEWKCKACDYSW